MKTQSLKSLKPNQDIQAVAEPMIQDNQALNEILSETEISRQVEILNAQESLNSNIENSPEPEKSILQDPPEVSLKGKKGSIESQVTIQAAAESTISHESKSR